MLNRSLLFVAAVLFAATAIERAPAVWRGPPQRLAALDPETRDWVKDLKNKVGSPAATRLTVSLSRSTAGIWTGSSTTHRR
jgi:hypothetical protein